MAELTAPSPGEEEDCEEEIDGTRIVERYFHMLDPDGHELSFARPLP